MFSVDNQVTIRDEIKAIFQPYPRVSHTSPYLRHSYPSLIERKGKGKEIKKYAHAKYIQKQKQKKNTFQKKLVVIKPMEQPSTTFTIKENLIFLRGMLPEMDYTTNEQTIRRIITSILNESVDVTTNTIGPYDFEFLEANGKKLRVLAKSSDLKWTGRAIKELAGSGCVYIRLVPEKSDLFCNTPEIVELEPVKSSPELELVKIERPGM